jgi:Dehydrogenases with different specificities (related to short-chain alcohol dehydrogenases)
MNGKTVVVTGATSGIGQVAAETLAGKGARIVFVARSESRGEAMLERLEKAGPGEHAFVVADLATLAGMKEAAAKLAALAPAIDVLINNAGAMFEKREVTADGLERTFALNHMAYFVVTDALVKHIKPGGRIVSTASDAHYAARLDFDDLQFALRPYKGFRVYGTSKLLNILFTRELARRAPGLTAVCLHPGFVATRFAANNSGLLGTTFAVLKTFAAIPPEKGARTIVHLASAADVDGKSGTYWYKCKPIKPSAAARSDTDARRLWEISERIAHG